MSVCVCVGGVIKLRARKQMVCGIASGHADPRPPGERTGFVRQKNAERLKIQEPVCVARTEARTLHLLVQRPQSQKG